MDAATKRGEDLGLTDEEVAFYDALAANESAVRAMGNDQLRVIAAELITMVRKSVTIDWTLREGARAKIGSLAAAARSACGLCFAQPVSVAPLLRLAGLAGGSGEDRAATGGVAVCGLGVIASSHLTSPHPSNAPQTTRFPVRSLPENLRGRSPSA